MTRPGALPRPGARASGWWRHHWAGLEISPRTVAHHLDNIYRKLDVSGRAAAVYRAVSEGMVSSRDNNRR